MPRKKEELEVIEGKNEGSNIPLKTPRKKGKNNDFTHPFRECCGDCFYNGYCDKNAKKCPFNNVVIPNDVELCEWDDTGAIYSSDINATRPDDNEVLDFFLSNYAPREKKEKCKNAKIKKEK